jgi:hypothetical protein
MSGEAIGWAADTMFVGQTLARLDPLLSQASLTKGIVGGRRPRIERRLHIQVSKPHGSLDWFQGPDGPLRTSIPVNMRRLIITPGGNKYRKGYDKPFDLHRELGNRAIDQASRLLILGYGFNDDHLETHLSERLRRGTPCVTLVRALTKNATKVVAEASAMTVLSENPANPDGFLCTRQAGSTPFAGQPLWQLAAFTQNILKP